MQDPQRNAGWCEAWLPIAENHHGVAASKMFAVKADGNSRNRVKGCWPHVEEELLEKRDGEREWKKVKMLAKAPVWVPR